MFGLQLVGMEMREKQERYVVCKTDSSTWDCKIRQTIEMVKWKCKQEIVETVIPVWIWTRVGKHVVQADKRKLAVTIGYLT